MTATQATRRREYLDNLADAAIAEADKEEAQHKARADAEKAELSRRRDILARADGIEQSRLTAVADAERSARAMADAIRDVLRLGGELRSTLKELGDVPAFSMSDATVERRLSERLSAVLRDITGHQTRFGRITIARTWRKPDEDWVADEKQAVTDFHAKLKEIPDDDRATTD